MDALDLLRAQHAEILGLFAHTGALQPPDRWCAIDILVEAIDLHLRVVPIFWSHTRLKWNRLDELAGLKSARDQLTALDPADPSFLSELVGLHEKVVRHMRREQERLLPALEQRVLGQARLSLAKEILRTIDELEGDHRHVQLDAREL